jgi:hypothetical protein
MCSVAVGAATCLVGIDTGCECVGDSMEIHLGNRRVLDAVSMLVCKALADVLSAVAGFRAWPSLHDCVSSSCSSLECSYDSMGTVSTVRSRWS